MRIKFPLPSLHVLSTVDALQVEVCSLVSAALNEPELDSELWMASAFIESEFRELEAGRESLSELGDLLRTAMAAEAKEDGLRAAVAWIWVGALRAAGLSPDLYDFALIDGLSCAGVQQTVYGSNVIHVDFQASRMALSPFGDNAVRHPNSRLILRDVGMQEVSHPDFRLPKSSGGVSRRTSVTNSVTAIRCDVDTDGDGDPPPSAPTPALLLPVAA